MNTQTSQTPERHPIKLEQALVILAGALALALRFLHLGSAPLSDAEARWALQSLALTNSSQTSGQIIIGAQPAYIFMTSWLFQLFGATTFLARFWPALTGSCLVLAPLLFRRQLTRPVALIAAFGLALDPGLVTVSRQAGGPMMALAFGLLALGAWNERKHLLAGFLAGLALLSGPAFIQGAVGIGIAWLAYRLVGDNSRPAIPDPEISVEATAQPVPTEAAKRSRGDPKMRETILALVVTVLVIGTDFLRYPQGLAGWMQSLAIYLEGWITPSGTNPFTLLAALVIFQPLALIFTIACIVRWLVGQNSGSENSQHAIWMLAFWLFASMILALFYPARQVADLVWVLVPVWGLAAIELVHFIPESKINIVSLLQAILVLILAVLLWNTLITTRQLVPTEGSSPATIQLILMLGIILLGSLTTILIGLGWSWEISRNGLVWGLTGTWLIYSISVLWGAAFLRPNQPDELWGVPPGPGQVDLMVSTIKEMSNRQTGLPQFIEIQSTVDNPSLRWALHTFQDIQFNSILPSENMPAVLITNQDQTAPALTADYRGQDFTWRVWPDWIGALPEDFINWLTFRQTPIINEHIILWVRSDLFTGTAQGGRIKMPGVPRPYPQTIAIDGPAASGKSTLGKLLADELGYLFFDTGVMYRAVTWAALQHGLPIEDEAAVTSLAEEAVIDIQPPSKPDGRNCDILVDGRDITWDIRSAEVEKQVSPVSVYPGVRRALTLQQRRIGLRGKVVMVGRDIGTVVLPEAELKIYLIASAEERARRRYNEVLARDGRASYQAILATIRQRDQIDSTRAVAPLRPAEDAVILDTDQMDVQQVLEAVRSLILKQTHQTGWIIEHPMNDQVYCLPLRTRLLRVVLRPLFRGLFHLLSDVRVSGKENVPTSGAYLITVNHISLFEPPFAIAFWPVAAEAAGAVDIWDRTGQSLLVRLYGVIPVRRDAYDRKAVEAMLAALNSDLPLVIFPEGGRTHSLAMRRALPGAAYVADLAGVPVVPVGIVGTSDDFLERALHGHRPEIEMRIGSPFRLPPITGKGEERRCARQKNADLIMRKIAALLPPEYHGVYAENSIPELVPESLEKG